MNRSAVIAATGTSLRPVQNATGTTGGSWCFDPDLRAKFGGSPLTPPQTLWIEIPDAGHHVMVDERFALVAALRTQFEAWQPAATLDRD